MVLSIIGMNNTIASNSYYNTDCLQIVLYCGHSLWLVLQGLAIADNEGRTDGTPGRISSHHLLLGESNTLYHCHERMLPCSVLFPLHIQLQRNNYIIHRLFQTLGNMSIMNPCIPVPDNSYLWCNFSNNTINTMPSLVHIQYCHWITLWCAESMPYGKDYIIITVYFMQALSFNLHCNRVTSSKVYCISHSSLSRGKIIFYITQLQVVVKSSNNCDCIPCKSMVPTCMNLFLRHLLSVSGWAKCD